MVHVILGARGGSGPKHFFYCESVLRCAAQLTNKAIALEHLSSFSYRVECKIDSRCIALVTRRRVFNCLEHSVQF